MFYILLFIACFFTYLLVLKIIGFVMLAFHGKDCFISHMYFILAFVGWMLFVLYGK